MEKEDLNALLRRFEALLMSRHLSDAEKEELSHEMLTIIFSEGVKQ